jgi:hypothetical protein
MIRNPLSRLSRRLRLWSGLPFFGLQPSLYSAAARKARVDERAAVGAETLKATDREIAQCVSRPRNSRNSNVYRVPVIP